VITFTIIGPPVGKARQRIRVVTPKFGKPFAMNYQPTEGNSAKYENLVKLSFRQVYCGNPIEGPLKIEIHSFFPIPASATKKFRTVAANEDTPVTKKPDGDNIIKIILDALNQIAYRDDAQIFDVRCVKLYSENPRTVVTIDADEQLPF
jgi:Holliday junction resolvase RusA-like endonuclease